jgi:hypothetical protein
MDIDLEKYIDLSSIKLEAYRLLCGVDNQAGFPYNLDIGDLTAVKDASKKEYLVKTGGSDEILVFLV